MIISRGKGRFGNKFFRNYYAVLLGEKYDMGYVIDCLDDFKKIHIQWLNKGGNMTNIKPIRDQDSYEYFLKKPDFTIDLIESYCQNLYMAKQILEDFPQKHQKFIEENNKFKERYENNNDLFIHYRIGDTEALGFMNPLDYFIQTISKISFDKGYIATDTPEHPNVKLLCKKYNLEILKHNLYDSILFASTCKHMILSLGTLSWIFGLYGFYSEIYYLNPLQIKYWHGPIFEITPWNCVTINSIPLREELKRMHNKLYLFPKETPCLIHIPKSGGTSLMRMNLPIYNHLHTCVSHLCPPSEYKYIVSLRNPIERVWSYYNMVLRSPKKFPYKEFSNTIQNFCNNCWEVQNITTRFLAGETKNLSDEEHMLQKAKDNLTNCFFIIDFDFFERDVTKLLQLLEIEGKTILNERNIPYNTKIPLDAVRVIMEANKLDIELYKFFKLELSSKFDY